MEFAYFTRIVAAFLSPSDVLIALLIAGAFLNETRFRRAGRVLLIVVATVSAAIFFLPVGQWIARPLENQFSRPSWPTRVDGILVLGGGPDAAIFAARNVTAPDAEIIAASELLHHYPNAKLIYSGGIAELTGEALPETSIARALFEQTGVNSLQVIWESKSRSTWENFVFSRPLAHPRSGQVWLVVTSALHMPRAIGVARKVGWPVVAWPSKYETGIHDGPRNWTDTFANRLDLIDLAVHEWAGLVAYRLTGRWAE